MHAELKALDSPEAVDGLDRYAPDDPEHFSLFVEASIGPAGEEGEELFGFIVATPSWLGSSSSLEKGFAFLRHHLLVERWDPAIVHRAISDLCRHAEGMTWSDVATALSRFGHWEFEDYRLASTSETETAVTLRLPPDLARFVERTVWDVGEHIAGARPIVAGPPELERELAALMWDVRDALGDSQPYDAERPPSRSRKSYVVRGLGG